MRNVKAFLKSNILFSVTLVLMAICAVCILIFSGLKHETVKVKAIIVGTCIVSVAMFLISDTLKFLILAFDAAWWPRQQAEFKVDKDATIHTRADYLKMRMNTLRSELTATAAHRNERLNLTYQANAKDLWLYGSYFLLLTSLVLVSRDSLFYYNTAHMKNLFMERQTYSEGLKMVRNINDLYFFVESTLVRPFAPDRLANGTENWLYGDHTAKLGVVRIRQLRRKENFHLGWGDAEFSTLDYNAKWALPYKRMQYTDKYWKIYAPWLPIYPTLSTTEKVFLNFDHNSYSQKFPEIYGYTTLLARSYNNSMKVVTYLKANDWLTWETSAVFFDFTLYNGDSAIFTIITLIVERTPFGTLEPGISLSSLNLDLIKQIGTLGLIILFVFMFVLIQYTKSMILMMWFEPSKMRSMWNRLDLIIILLNYGAIILEITNSIVIKNMLFKVETSSKMVFIDFRLPERVHAAGTVIVGFLICLTTLRLWRVLQFASVFKMFSSTLFSAWKALASIAGFIFIFLMGFGIALVTINGNSTATFNKLFRSIISSMCFSFGFTSHIKPKDLLYGGRLLGLVLYLILAFVVVQLINSIFPSTINDFFTTAKHNRDVRPVREINFLQFLRVEYARIFNFFTRLSCFNRSYKRHNRTVAENVKRYLDTKHHMGVKGRYMALSTSSDFGTSGDAPDEKYQHDLYKRRVERLYTVAALMLTQMELLEVVLFKQEEKFKEDNEFSDSGSVSDAEYV